VDLGQFVSTGQELGRIFATDVVEVPMPITDDELGRVGLPVAFAATPDNPGPRVVFRGNVAGERRVWEGRITRTAASIDPRTRLIDVIGEVKDPYGEGADDGVPLAPGAFVDAEIIGPTIEDVLIAPRAALRGENEIYLGDTETGTLAIREVDVIHTDAKGAYLGKGVEAGELAIVSPVQAAFDGMRVKVLERRPDGEVIVHEPPAEAGDVSEETGPGEPGAQAAASRAQGGSR